MTKPRPITGRMIDGWIADLKWQLNLDHQSMELDTYVGWCLLEIEKDPSLTPYQLRERLNHYVHAKYSQS